VLAVVLAGLAYWQRDIAVQERQIAEQQRKRAEETLAAATKTANSLVFDLAQRFKNTVGIPSDLIKDILDRARGLQEQLTKSGELTPELKYSKSAALNESSRVRKLAGDTTAALADARQSKQIMEDLVAGNPGNKSWRHDLATSPQNLGDVQSARGDFQGAISSFRDCLAIAQALAAADPENRGLQHGLAIAYDKVADMQYAIGNHQDALRTFGDEIAVSERLVKADPNNAVWQHLLAVGREHVGFVQQARHDVGAAAESYRTERDILAAVTASHPDNAVWLHRFATVNKTSRRSPTRSGKSQRRTYIVSRRTRKHGTTRKDRSGQCDVAARFGAVL
jgi:tetratricopeptide (TPR) repeat protein